MGLIVASLILLIIVLLTDQGEPARGERPHRCKAEDEMVVRVEEDAYTFRKGQTVCVHVDQIHAEETR